MIISSLATNLFEVGNKTYVSSKTKKTNIVIHSSFSRTKYTATAVQPDETSLMHNWGIMADKVAGHYVIGRNGSITACFDESYWSNHLGPHKRYSELNKSTIAVYLCNELYLQKENSKYYAFGYVHPHNMYKGKVFEHSLKGYKFWADYDEAQIDSLSALLLDLCARHEISKKVIRKSTVYKPYVEEHAGIFFPCNVNRDSYSSPMPEWMANKLESRGLYLTK